MRKGTAGVLIPPQYPCGTPHLEESFPNPLADIDDTVPFSALRLDPLSLISIARKYPGRANSTNGRGQVIEFLI